MGAFITFIKKTHRFLFKKLFFIANSLKLLYTLKGVLVAYATTNRALKPETSYINLSRFAGIPEFREILLCPGASYALKAKC